MGRAKDFARSLRPGNDHELAAQLRREQEARERRKAAEHAAAVKAIAEAEERRTAEDRQASAERARRGKQELARKGHNSRLT
ncbi:hypothetical protein ACIP2X_18825 [Streptomyces sp. NPDC089424]|uniref:hypothetical protein n=1 Tax=Streptomyces sp. NPDC089424 TaxID=3365917 RepID=UPI00381D0E70